MGSIVCRYLYIYTKIIDIFICTFIYDEDDALQEN